MEGYLGTIKAPIQGDGVGALYVGPLVCRDLLVQYLLLRMNGNTRFPNFCLNNADSRTVHPNGM